MLNRLWSFLTGYLTLIIEGSGLERLINMAVSRGLYVWDVKWIDREKAILKIRISGFRALRHIARRSGNRIKIGEKSGLPFRLERLKKRKMLIIGAVLSLILVNIMASFVWFVDVKGTKKVPVKTVLNAAKHAGLGVGTVRYGLDKDRIERDIRNNLPQLAWVGVTVEGTRVIVEVAEKTAIPAIDKSPANVVAKKDGLVEEILVLSGKSVVNEKQMVRQGDLLITGVITPEIPEEGVTPEQENSLKLIPTRYVRAKGLVRAKVWYEGFGECPLIKEGVKRTGKSVQSVKVKMYGKVMNIKGPKSPSFRNYVEVTDSKQISMWRNIRLPVEVVTTSYYEVSSYRDIISVSKAKTIASELALMKARKLVPKGSRFVAETTEDVDGGDGNVKVRAIVEVIEDIGETKTIDSRFPQLN